MVSSTQLYELFLLKANRGDSNGGVSILPSRFVLLFRSEARKFTDRSLDKDSKNSQINKIEELYVVDQELKHPLFTNEFVKYKLSENFADFGSSYSLIDTTCCKNQKIFNYLKIPGNINPVMEDDSYQPSADYQEAPALISDGRIKIFRNKEYKIKKTFISYHRYPVDIDIEGYEKEDGSFSKTVDSDLTYTNAVKVVERVVREVLGIHENQEGLSVATQKVIENES